MRCLSCDVILTDKEATRKYVNADFVDLCDGCYSTIADQVETVCNPLASDQPYDDHDDQED